MAEAERILAALGAVPKGAVPKTILAGDQNQEPGYYQTDPLSNVVRILKTRQLEIDAEVKKKQEAAQKKADMYKTLREAGYDPKSAYEAVIKGTLTPPGPEDTALKKTTREKILDKLARGETLSEGEQQIYDETIKKKQEEDLLGNALGDVKINSTREKIMAKIARGETLLPGEQKIYDETVKKGSDTPTQQAMRGKIMAKIAAGQDLTPGEQKVYDEVIKKGNTDNLSDVLKNQQEEMVSVIAPDGRKGKIPKSKLAAALKVGYKKR